LRWSAIAAGAVLVVAAFAAATQVADTRAGLIAEVVLLFSGLAGICLLVFGLAARRGLPAAPALRAMKPSPGTGTRSRNDAIFGGGGVAVAVILLAGLAFSGDALLAALGLALLLPMIAGSVYLCLRFLRSAP
jgi:hypothetical protein